VLLDLSDFLIKGLERLDLSYLRDNTLNGNPQEQINGFVPKSKMTFEINQTLLVLENPEISEKCVVLQVDTNMTMTSAEPRLVQEQLRDGESCEISKIHMDIH